jgi:hypothetical protein
VSLRAGLLAAAVRCGEPLIDGGVYACTRGLRLETAAEFERIAEGFHARVVQHECDHLDGILYPMRVEDFSRFGYADVLFPELVGQGDD